jgi:broad specificity phosphatase PhoE
MSVTRLFLIRHAEVEARYQNLFGGRIDMNLSPHGHVQARALAGYLDRLPLDAVYASPMKRVQQTLAPWLTNGTPRPVVLADLREVDFGDWTDLGWDAVKERFGHSAWDWLHHLERGEVPNGETGESFRARVEPCVRQIVHEQPGRNVAIACHGGVIRMILSIVLEMPLAQTTSLAVDYASVARVALESPRAELELLNFAPWRDRV